MSPLNYISEFNNIVETVMEVAYQRYTYQTFPFLEALATELNKIVEEFGTIIPISKEDLVQELNMLWLSYKKTYKENRPKVSLRSYLISRSIWGLRDWLHKQGRTTFIPFPNLLEGETKQGDLIDFNFVLKGGSLSPFKVLNAYQRYVLFLRYGREMSIDEITNLLQKSQPTVRKQLREIIEKIRSEYDKGTNTRGYGKKSDPSKRGDSD